MARRKTRDKLNNEVNAGSMADIAFLLLIFFLVTTTIANDSGILVKLPPFEIDKAPQPIAERNVYKILVNENNEILGRGKPLKIDDIREKIMLFIDNPLSDPSLSKSPKKAIVSLQTDRGTKYGIYIKVYNEIKGGYNELREALSIEKYGQPYSLDKLTSKEYAHIRDYYPIILSEVDPIEY